VAQIEPGNHAEAVLPLETGLDGLQALAGKAVGGYRSVGTMVYDILRDAIIQGVLSPGEKLRQETLADAIGVSRVPVRSALIQLEADGLVEVFDRRGAVVKTLSASQVEEIYDLRDLLEGHALRKAMDSVTPERITRLRQLAEVADSQEEGAEFVRAREDFYAELYDATNNPLLWEAIEDLRLKVGRYMLGWRLAGGHGHTHAELVDTVANGETEAALGLLREHLASVRDGVVAMIARDAAARDPERRAR
jgi:DNA-binding GntR family transcriptional regulator